MAGLARASAYEEMPTNCLRGPGQGDAGRDGPGYGRPRTPRAHPPAGGGGHDGGHLGAGVLLEARTGRRRLLPVIAALAVASVLPLRHWPGPPLVALVTALAVALANAVVRVALGERLPRWSLR